MGNPSELFLRSDQEGAAVRVTVCMEGTSRDGRGRQALVSGTKSRQARRMAQALTTTGLTTDRLLEKRLGFQLAGDDVIYHIAEWFGIDETQPTSVLLRYRVELPNLQIDLERPFARGRPDRRGRGVLQAQSRAREAQKLGSKNGSSPNRTKKASKNCWDPHRRRKKSGRGPG